MKCTVGEKVQNGMFHIRVSPYQKLKFFLGVETEVSPEHQNLVRPYCDNGYLKIVEE
tara:strand:- start:468 stop:638 length:171 start_codon:yes stop_codon:yes gene_type:complete